MMAWWGWPALSGYLVLCLLAYGYVQIRRRSDRPRRFPKGPLGDALEAVVDEPRLLSAAELPCPVYGDAIHGFTVEIVGVDPSSVVYVRRCVCGAGTVSPRLARAALLLDPPRLKVLDPGYAIPAQDDPNALRPYAIEFTPPPIPKGPAS